MSITKKSIALAVGGAFALSLSAATVSAAENPFAIKTLSSGYQVAEHHGEKGADGKCGEGKCGERKTEEGKCGEGKCGADKTKDGKCGEGKCGGDEKMKEGKCGEGKCGH
jgi:uncharacterized low-complexity protein